MARMHARRRGKSCSVRPYRKQAPAWSNTDAKAITKVILDLRKEGASGSRIGLVLRDRYGVPDVKLALGKRIGDILRENKVASEIPEDLRDLMSQGARAAQAPGREQERSAQQAAAAAHRVQDPSAREVLRRKQETAQRFHLQTRERRDSAVQVRVSIVVRIPMSLETIAETVAEQIRRQEYIELLCTP